MQDNNKSKPTLPALAVLTGGLGAGFAITSLLGKLTRGTLKRPIGDLDKALSNGTRTLKASPLDRLMFLVSGAGEPFALYPVAGAIAAWWVTQNREKDALGVGVALMGSAALNKAVKSMVERPRPHFELPLPRLKTSGSGFPSSHAAMSLATYGTIAYLAVRRPGRLSRKAAARLWVSALLFAALIGWSRVYLGVHRPTDVFGGWLEGSICIATCGLARSLM